MLRGSFYVPTAERREKSAPRAEKPTHYKVICISMYTDDLERLDEMVETLKARGLTKANRSALIRYALVEREARRSAEGACEPAGCFARHG